MSNGQNLWHPDYFKVDFHVHTPFSHCYIDTMEPDKGRRTTPDDIVQAALKAHLDAIAITDHNGGDWIEKIRASAAGTGLVIFPGVELSVRAGHLLAIFDVDMPVDAINDLVQITGFEQEQRGDGFVQSPVWMDDTFVAIEEFGGIAIPAHIDRWFRGFIAGNETIREKQRIHSNALIDALEITVPQDKELWTQGLMPKYPTPHACIQASDAHAPEEVGRRPIFFKVPQLDLEHILLAFREHDERVLFPHELLIDGS